MKILVAEDREDTRFVIKDLLKDHTITFATDGLKAAEIARKNKFNLIISDYDMPGGDGFLFLGKVNELKDRPPFLLFTSSEIDRSAAYKAGVQCILDKRPDNLKRAVDFWGKII